jgi:hypothetical protein
MTNPQHKDLIRKENKKCNIELSHQYTSNGCYLAYKVNLSYVAVLPELAESYDVGIIKL